MKILAIRGRNLASLAGEFAVDLLRPPLSGEGLFAITGQTGSGKSTLLDAMCLALFDRTPRLPKGEGRVVGRDEEDKKRQVGNSDPRALLRNGTAEGEAEVDFLGVDERVYRSRWSIRRARNKAGGKLQQSRMELWDVAAEKRLDSDKKGETLAEIEARLGLGFEQFRRSVLLPQGEFAAFLKASEQERGELLERMTSTGIYREISRAAFERNKAEQQALKLLEDRLAVLDLLSEEARQELTAALEQARRQEGEAAAALARAEAAVVWHARRSELASAEAEARAELEAGVQRLEVLTPIQAELDAIGAVEALRPLLAGQERSRQAAEVAGQEAARLEAGQPPALAEAGQAVEAATAADASLLAARARQEALAGPLEQAARLDVELRSLGQAVGEALREERDAEAAREDATRQIQRLEADQQGAQEAAAQAGAWLAEREVFSGLVEGWAGWSRLMQQAAVAWRQLAEAPAQRRALEAEAGQARAEQAAARAALQEAEEVLAARREQVASARAALAETSGAALREEQRALFARRDRLRSLSPLRQRLLELLQRQQGRQQDAHKAREEGVLAVEVARIAEEQRQQRTWALAEAERFLDHVREQEMLTGHRERLTAGQPCPLCGSTAHPLKGAPRSMAALFEVQQQRVRELQVEQGELALRGQQARTDAARLEGEAHAALAEAEVLSGRAGELRAEWGVVAEGLGLPDPDAQEAGALLVAESGRVQLALDRLEADLAALAGLQAALEAAEQAREGAAERREIGAERLRRASARQDAAEGALAAVGVAEARARAQWEEVSAELAAPLAPLGEWQAALQREAEGFVARCGQQVQEIVGVRGRLEAARRALEEGRPRLEALRERRREREGSLRRLTAARLEREARLRELQEQRQRLLGGQSAEAVQRALREDLERAGQAQQEAGRRREGAERRLAELSARLDAARQERARRRQEAEEAEATLRQALEERGLRREDVQSRLQRSPAWVQEQRARIEAARAGLARARAVLQERHERLLAHQEGAAAPELSAEASGMQRATREAEREAARRERYRVQGVLEGDEASRRRAADLLAQRDVQRAVSEHWEEMRKLIGSADGRTFSQFAQSLTLDAMVVQANSHLAGLSRRYSLMRVPGEDLLLQVVDHYHGEEVRSVNSLSGGESFLVSLALALGLATLSARDTRISSLFIDEGFGTLDPDTLDVALSSLDALQASGRQVGLISHIPGMAERIGVQVQVIPRGGGRSVVRVVGG